MFFFDLQDKRNYTVKKILSKKYKTAVLEKTSEIKQGDVIVYSPAKKFDLSEALSLPSGITVYCGNVCEQIQKIFKEKYITVKNLLKDEIFAIENAKLTAEGVLSIIISNTDKSIFEQKILLLGGGRITKACCVLFKKLGVNCSVASFSQSEYFNAFYYSDKRYLGNDFYKEVGLYDVIINTRPFLYITDDKVDKIKKDALFIETASENCLNVTSVKNFKYFLAPKLPQKFSPYSAGRIIAEKILGDIND